MTECQMRPALSVVLLAPGGTAPLAAVLRRLQAQTIRSELEVVLVVSAGGSSAVRPERLAGFRSVRHVPVATITAIGPAYAAGVRAAQAEVVAFGEDHCFPEPDWAEALLAAHGEGIAAVGPALRNANPGNAVSWADLLMAYAPWLHPAPAMDVPFLPGHNSSYRRQVLLACGDRLEALLDTETLLHWELRRRGLRLRLEPRAIAAHTNFGQLFPWLPVQFRCGRLFAAARCGGWSPLARLLYGVAAPLIPARRLWRIGRELARPERLGLRLPPGTWWLLLLGLAADGLGQSAGAVFGPGDAARGFAEAEFQRERWLGGSRRAAEAAWRRPPC